MIIMIIPQLLVLLMITGINNCDANTITCYVYYCVCVFLLLLLVLFSCIATTMLSTITSIRCFASAISIIECYSCFHYWVLSLILAIVRLMLLLLLLLLLILVLLITNILLITYYLILLRITTTILPSISVTITINITGDSLESPSSAPLSCFEQLYTIPYYTYYYHTLYIIMYYTVLYYT